MLRKSRISAAIAFALASAAAVVAPSVYAEEEGQSVEQLQKIKVTGSRISRVDVEGSTPVVSVSKAQIEQSGQQTVADYLKQASYNSFGGVSPSSGSSFQSQGTVGLRGLGSERTLVLLNGKRVAGSPPWVAPPSTSTPSPWRPLSGSKSTWTAAPPSMAPTPSAA